MDDVVARGPAGEIDPRHRHLVGQANVGAVALGDRGIDLTPAPARIIRKQPGRERARILHAGTARGLEAVVRAEELLVAGVMHVDGIRIGHVDAHGPERVPVSGSWRMVKFGARSELQSMDLGSISWPCPSSTRMCMRST